MNMIQLKYVPKKNKLILIKMLQYKNFLKGNDDINLKIETYFILNYFLVLDFIRNRFDICNMDIFYFKKILAVS